MLTTIATYRKGKNAAHVMYNNHDRRIFIMHEDKNGATQFPVMYKDGRIAYDRSPVQYIRPAIEKAFRAKKAFEFIQTYPGWHGFAKCESDVIHDLQKAGLVRISNVSSQFMIV